MLACFAEWLSRQSIDFTVVAENAANVRAATGFSAVQNYRIVGKRAWIGSVLRGRVFGALRAIATSDLVICGGGDTLRDGIGWRTFSYQVEKLAFALLLRKPVYLLNVGIPSPVTFYGRAALRWLLPRSSGIVVRESRSYEVCRALGAGSRVRLQPDIVLSMRDFFPASAEAVPQTNSVLVALRGDPNVYGHYELTAARLDALAAGLDSLVESRGVTVAFFPYQVGEEGDDHRVHREIQKRMAHPASTVLLDWTSNVDALARLFRGCRLVIAMRLHAAVLAASFRKPCVLLPYDRKVADFGVQAGIPYVLPAESLDSPAAAALVFNSALGSSPPQSSGLPEGGGWPALTIDEIGGRFP